MRIVAAVDGTDRAFAVIQEVINLYVPQELVLLHVKAPGPLETYPLRPAIEDHVHRALHQARQSQVDAAKQRLEQIATQIPSEIASVKRRCEVGPAASTVLDMLRSEAPDLVVVGHRGLGPVAELTMGSISHRLLMHAPCPILVVKGSPKMLHRVLLAVEGPEDAQRLQAWLLRFPFKSSPELSVLHVVPRSLFADLKATPASDSWAQAATRLAQGLVTAVAAALNGSHSHATGQVVSGDPVEVIAQETSRFDLLIVSSHGRQGLSRFLLGSVSHSLVHRVACPILVVRESS
jgi:nucleotide-binding universal stress UspA family protein